MRRKVLKGALFSGVLIPLLLNCGGGGSSSADAEYSHLSVSLTFVNATTGTLSKQQITSFPEGVEVVEIDVCETPNPDIDYRQVNYSDICQNAVIPKDYATISYTFEGLESGKEYTVGVTAYNEDGVILYAGGTTLVLNPGDNTVKVIAIQFPPPEEYKSELLRSIAVFYDFKEDIYDFYLDTALYRAVRFEPLEVGCVLRADLSMQVISEAEDNGSTIPVGRIVVVPDDGKHFDFDAGDGKYNLRLKLVSGTEDPAENMFAYVKLEEPYGNIAYDFFPFDSYNVLPRVSAVDRSGSVTVETSNGDLIWEEGETIYIHHTLNTPVGVVVCLENSEDTVNIDGIQGDLFETIFFSGKVYCQSYFTQDFYDAIEFPPDEVENFSFFMNIFADKKYFNFNQMRFFVIDKTTGLWQVSVPVQF